MDSLADMLWDFVEKIYRLEPLFIVVILMICFVAVLILPHYIKYIKSTYYKITGNSFFTCYFRNLGQKGEFLIYDNLKREEKKGACFLFNVYIPKDDGQTSEIDVLMICSDGIFVFESKNFSGWIFGDERRKKWCQIFPSGRGKSKKEFFYNPIMQNRGHIKCLKALLGDNTKMYSVITFSDRCKLKKISVQSDDVKVIHRYDVLNAVRSFRRENADDCISDAEINKIYYVLYPYTQISSEAKKRHIDDIRCKLMPHVSHKYSLVYPDEDECEEEEHKEILYVREDTENGDTEICTQDIDFEEKDKETLRENLSQLCRCPLCGGELILRTAKRGHHKGDVFYGCSNYPKCRYIKNM